MNLKSIKLLTILQLITIQNSSHGNSGLARGGQVGASALGRQWSGRQNED